MDPLPLHMPQAKRCILCQAYKDRDEFGKDKYRPDGISDRCFECKREISAQSRLADPGRNKRRYAANKDAILAQQAGYYYANKDKLRPTRRAYDRANKARIKVLRDAAHLVNPEKRRARERAWIAKNPGYSTEKWRRREALIRGAGMSNLSDEQFEEIQRIQRHRCYYCGKRDKEGLTRNHVVPVSEGGSDTASNIVAACRSCNSMKQAGPPPIPVQLHLLTEAPPKTPRTRRKQDTAS